MKMPIQNRSPRFIEAICGVLGTALAAGILHADDRYVLKVPGTDDLTSIAEFERDRLVITDPQGRVHTYRRTPALDSADGRYAGCYSRGAQQSLRWPKNDAGAMLIGDSAGRGWRASRQRIQTIQPRNPRPLQPVNQPPVVNKIPAGGPEFVPRPDR